MNIIEAANHLINNRDSRITRKSKDSLFLMVKEIGWMSQYKKADDVLSNDPKDNFIMMGFGNLILGSFEPSLDDILANDYEIIK